MSFLLKIPVVFSKGECTKPKKQHNIMIRKYDYNLRYICFYKLENFNTNI